MKVKNNQEIAQAVGYSVRRIPQLLREYKETVIKEYSRSKYGGNHRSLSEEEEKEILDTYATKAKSGQIVTVQEIKKTFDKRIGKDTTEVIYTWFWPGMDGMDGVRLFSNMA